MNAITRSSADTDSLGTVTATSLSDDLQPIIPLILDVALREQVLAKFDGPKRLVAEEIFQCAGQLTSMTEWSEERLLEALGCKIKTVAEFHDVELEGLERCRAFLRLVTRNAGLLDTVLDRREVVIESAKLLKAVGGNATRLEELQEAKVGLYTAIDFIRLGEIEAATEHVRNLADTAAIGQTMAVDDPFAELPTVHLSTTRIDMLIRGRRKDLGEEVANHMALHIEDCPGCRDAYDYRLSHLNP
jgi:hypothetical protein